MDERYRFIDMCFLHNFSYSWIKLNVFALDLDPQAKIQFYLSGNITVRFCVVYIFAIVRKILAYLFLNFDKLGLPYR